jgi:TRAP-type C4-dicarboxylate transport system permease small subunit
VGEERAWTLSPSNKFQSPSYREDSMKKLIHFLQRTFLDWVCMVFLLITVFLISFQVLNRYFLHLPVAWTEEMTRYAFVWLCLLGAVRGVRDNTHIKVDIFVNIMSLKVQRIFDIVIGMIVIILLISLIVSGLELLPVTLHRRASTIDVSLFYLYVSIPLCGFLMFVFMVKNTLESFRKTRG